MSISAMKYALQALENPWGTGAEGVANAIIFLRQAIAEAEKQEAVAWMWKDGTLTSDPDFADGTWTPLFTAPVHAIDILQERVDETAKYRHDLWIAAACLKSTVESAIKAGDWKVDGACDPTRDLAYLADCLANPKHEWVEQPDLARVGEVGVWGDKREWVGLTEQERDELLMQWEAKDSWDCFDSTIQAIEAKLKEKNT